MTKFRVKVKLDTLTANLDIPRNVTAWDIPDPEKLHKLFTLACLNGRTLTSASRFLLERDFFNWKVSERRLTLQIKRRRNILLERRLKLYKWLFSPNCNACREYFTDRTHNHKPEKWKMDKALRFYFILFFFWELKCIQTGQMAMQKIGVDVVA